MVVNTFELALLMNHSFESVQSNGSAKRPVSVRDSFSIILDSSDHSRKLNRLKRDLAQYMDTSAHSELKERGKKCIYIQSTEFDPAAKCVFIKLPHLHMGLVNDSGKDCR